MKDGIKLKGQLATYMRWPFVLTLLLVVMDVLLYTVSWKAGGIGTIFTAVYLLLGILLYFHRRPVILNELISFATQYGQVQKSLMKNFALPYALLDAEGKILWMNDEFLYLTGKDQKYRKFIGNIFPEVTMNKLPMPEEVRDLEIAYQDHDFRLNMRRVEIDELLDGSQIIDADAEKNYLIAAYLFDETELKKYMRKNKEEQLVTGLLYLDNYEEALESVEEVRSSLLIALIDRKINKYFAAIDGVVKKLEKDKYFLVMRRKSLEQLKEKKFNILEEVKSVNIGNEMAVTISIGIGINADSFAHTSEAARIAMELALGRGGDQVVIKNGNNITYYGGKSQQVEKNTRVKARVKAHALREIITGKDRVIVMGHRMPDVDSFGSAVGIYRIAQTLGRKAHIVLNEATTSVQPLVELFKNNPEYDEDMIITSQQAIDMAGSNTVLVVVDVNKPSITECPDLLRFCKSVVVLDHHRQGTETIENATLSYVEPYASSACEMVSEILQYTYDNIKIRTEEADCMYSGIMIDTNNFMTKTGVRTFEAAAFLRRNGADVTRVRKLFREDAAEYKAKADAVSQAEIYKQFFAISLCTAEDLPSPTIIGAQAANELLNIKGIKASFVLTDYQGKIYVSARSIDEVNVQILSLIHI